MRFGCTSQRHSTSTNWISHWNQPDGLCQCNISWLVQLYLTPYKVLKASGWIFILATRPKTHLYLSQTWNLSKILHRRIFRLKILHRQFHLILTVLVRKNTKNEWKWRNLHRWQKFYTAAGSDGMDKFHLCVKYPLCVFLCQFQINFMPILCQF